MRCGLQLAGLALQASGVEQSVPPRVPLVYFADLDCAAVQAAPTLPKFSGALNNLNTYMTRRLTGILPVGSFVDVSPIFRHRTFERIERSSVKEARSIRLSGSVLIEWYSTCCSGFSLIITPAGLSVDVVAMCTVHIIIRSHAQT